MKPFFSDKNNEKEKHWTTNGCTPKVGPYGPPSFRGGPNGANFGPPHRPPHGPHHGPPHGPPHCPPHVPPHGPPHIMAAIMAHTNQMLTTTAQNNQQQQQARNVCKWYLQRGVCKRFKSPCPMFHPGAIKDNSGMVHERPPSSQMDQPLLPPAPGHPGPPETMVGSGKGFGGNRGGPGGRRNQDEEMGDPNNPNNAPLGPRPTRPTFGGPQSSDQAPLLPDQCRSMNQSQQNFKYTVQPPPPPGMPPNIATTSQQNNFSQNTTTNTPALQSKIPNPDIIKKPSIITKNPIKYPEDKVRDEMNHFYSEIQGPKNQESESNSSNNGGRWDVQPSNNKHKLIPYEDSDSEGDDDGNWKRKRR